MKPYDITVIFITFFIIVLEVFLFLNTISSNIFEFSLTVIRFGSFVVFAIGITVIHLVDISSDYIYKYRKYFAIWLIIQLFIQIYILFYYLVIESQSFTIVLSITLSITSILLQLLYNHFKILQLSYSAMFMDPSDSSNYLITSNALQAKLDEQFEYVLSIINKSTSKYYQHQFIYLLVDLNKYFQLDINERIPKMEGIINSIENHFSDIENLFPNSSIFIPQLMFIVLFYWGDEVSGILLNEMYQICSRNLHYSQEMFWFVNSFVHDSRAGQLKNQIACYGEIAAIKFNESYQQSYSKNHNQYEISEMTSFYQPLYPIRYSLGHDFPYFQHNITFWNEISDVAVSVFEESRNRKQRTNILRVKLCQVNSNYFPASCIYNPVDDTEHRINRIIEEESFAFSTKSRAPLFLCLEVIYQDKDKDNTNSSRRWWELSKEIIIDTFKSMIPREINESSKLVEINKAEFQQEANLDQVKESSPSLLDSYQNPESKDNIPSNKLSDVNLGQWESPQARSQSNNSVDTTDYIATKNQQPSWDIDPSTENQSKRDIIIVFKERWMQKVDRIRTKSPMKDCVGYDLIPIIFKNLDDLRQEQLISQIIYQMNSILEHEHINCWLRPYKIIAISESAGIIEAIPDTVSLDVLKRTYQGYTSLLNFFETFYSQQFEKSKKTAENDIPTLKEAKNNFLKSLAGYCIICYLLQIKDRHNGNILLDIHGHIIHIDYGFVLGKGLYI